MALNLKDAWQTGQEQGGRTFSRLFPDGRFAIVVPVYDHMFGPVWAYFVSDHDPHLRRFTGAMNRPWRRPEDAMAAAELAIESEAKEVPR